MPTWVWIVIAVVVLIAVAVAIGLVLARRRTVSLRTTEQTAERKPVATRYNAGGSISFSSGSLLERTETDGQPGVGDDASIPRDSIRPDIMDLELPSVDIPVFAPVDRPVRPDELVSLHAGPPSSSLERRTGSKVRPRAHRRVCSAWYAPRGQASHTGDRRVVARGDTPGTGA